MWAHRENRYFLKANVSPKCLSWGETCTLSRKNIKFTNPMYFHRISVLKHLLNTMNKLSQWVRCYQKKKTFSSSWTICLHSFYVEFACSACAITFLYNTNPLQARWVNWWYKIWTKNVSLLQNKTEEILIYCLARHLTHHQTQWR